MKTIALILISIAALTAVVDNLRVRRKLVEARAAKVVEALADTVVVDGIQLPKPEDSRWGSSRRQSAETKANIAGLSCGAVFIGLSTPFNGVYVAGEIVPPTKATRAYVDAVIATWRSRVVVKSLGAT